jgi:hypothetical protein
MSATPNVRSVFTHNGNQVVFGENLNIEANALREPFEFNQNGPVGSLISQLVVHRDQSNAEMTKLLDKLRSEGNLLRIIIIDGPTPFNHQKYLKKFA